MNILVISAAEIEKYDCLPQTIDALRAAFAELRAGSVVMPPRSILQTSPSDSRRQLLAMPAAMSGLEVASVKVTTLTPANAGRGLALIHGVVVLVELSTGRVVSLLDGAEVTAVRTGATSGLATQYLARADASVLAVIGAGVQARAQLRGVVAVRNVKSVLVFSRTPEGAAEFASWAAGRDGFDLRVNVCGSAREAVEQADIVCTATSTDSPSPVIAREWIRPGTHLNVIGGVNEHACELDPEALRGAHVAVEQKDAALEESGEIREALRRGFLSPDALAELGGVVTGEAAARTSPEQITVFRSVGIAVQDTAAARAIYERVSRSGGGTRISL
jgi:ornithine cyclodeaminase